MTVVTEAQVDTLSAIVAKRVRGLLGEQGRSQAWLARELGVSQMYVSDRIRIGGRTPLDLNDVARIAGVFSLTLADLVPQSILQAIPTDTGRYHASGKRPKPRGMRTKLSLLMGDPNHHAADPATDIPDSVAALTTLCADPDLTRPAVLRRRKSA